MGGDSRLGKTEHPWEGFFTVRPGCYSRRVYELLGITIPRTYARRFYNMILGHQAIMSNDEERDVSIQEAAEHWYTQSHLPPILLLRNHLTTTPTPINATSPTTPPKSYLTPKPA